MRRALVLAVAFLAGCSNAPIAGFLDNTFPAKPPPPDRPPAGGAFVPEVGPPR